MEVKYRTKGDDAAVFAVPEGFLVIERGEVGEMYDVVRVHSSQGLIRAIEVADAWQEWVNMVKARKVSA